jgi:hypothetical protein
VSAVYDAAPRKSFVAALKDVPELWELTYDEAPSRSTRATSTTTAARRASRSRGPFPPRRTKLDAILDDFFFDPTYAYVIGAARDGKGGQVVNLDVRRKVADVPLPGLPHLASGISWTWQDRPGARHAESEDGVVSVIDMKTGSP